LGNHQGGVFIDTRGNNLIGGTAAGAGNVISGNAGPGITLLGGSSTVQGNNIRTDASASHMLRNATGVSIRSNLNTLGGTAPGAGNLISGNRGDGITISGQGARGNLVQGNVIGTDGSGTSALGNSIGVHISGGASTNTIGGTAASGAGNLVSGNKSN